MKWIKYKTQVESTIERGVAEDGTPITEKVMCTTMRTVPYSAENEALAKEQAYNGEITLYDDGQEEPEQQLTTEERIAELEEAIEMLLSGVTEE